MCPPNAATYTANVKARQTDLLLAAAVTLSLALIIATNDRGTRSADIFAYLFAVALGALLLLRRSMPRTVLLLSVLVMFAYYTRDYPPIGVAVPVVAALYSVAEAGRMLWATVSAFAVFAISLVFRIRDDIEPLGILLGYESVSNLALFAAAIALGYAVRTRRQRVEQESQLKVQAERERVSRELHDTVGHTLSVISLHAGVGTEAVGADDEAARLALERIKTASGRSLAELRAMVKLLRNPDGRSVTSLAAIDELVTAAETAGLKVSTSIEIDPAELSPAIDATAFRILQESVTNVIRHAGASELQITASLTDGRLKLRVSDNGHGASATPGSGITGMQERARLLGGTLAAGSDTAQGFTVEAELPARLP